MSARRVNMLMLEVDCAGCGGDGCGDCKRTGGVTVHLCQADRRCRACGCTDEQACPGGCHWITPTLCSRCSPTTTKGKP